MSAQHTQERLRADDRAHRIATMAAEELIRCEGTATSGIDEFAIPQCQADDHMRDCIAHLCWRGEAVSIAPDEFDGAAKMLRDLRGENAVLAGLLRDCDAVLATIEADDGEEAESVRDLRTALAYALDPYKREGTLL